MTDIRYIAFISPALHAKLIAFKSEPKPTRKTARQRRSEGIEKRLAKEQADREEAFQRRVDAISGAIYQPFQPRERCVLSNEPILSDEQRRVYAFQTDFDSVGTASRRKLKRELKAMRRKQLAGVLES